MKPFRAWIAGLAFLLLTLAVAAPAQARARTAASSRAVTPLFLPHDEEGQGGGAPIAPQPAMASTACQGGFAGPYPCSGVDLLSFLPHATISGTPGERGAGLWAWFDAATGHEYALVAQRGGTSFVDVTDPARPVYLGTLPTRTASSSNREVNVYRDHAFVAADGGGAEGHGLQIFDLTRLLRVTSPQRFTETAVFTGVGRIHNVAINPETGFAYLCGTDRCGGGLFMLDISNPGSPRPAGCYVNQVMSYVHDVQCVIYRGADSRFAGREVCFASNVDALTIVDVTDKSAPRELSRTSYDGAGYTHQGWLTEDHRYFLLDDEADENLNHHNTRTYLWDLRDLTAPRQFATHQGISPAVDHNQYVHKGLVYQANYRSGLHILDLAQIASGRLREVGFFDVVPEDDSPFFGGAWAVYPFLPSGNLLVNGIEQGLFVLRRTAEGPAQPPVPSVCRPGAERLCLLGGRFQVEVDWRNQFDGHAGRGRAIRGSDVAGFFAFEDRANVELMVKLLDLGNGIAFFYGQLTNLEFTLRVADTRTGQVKTYGNGPGNCGGIDPTAFTSTGAVLGTGVGTVHRAMEILVPGEGIPGDLDLGQTLGAHGDGHGTRPAKGGGCAPAPGSLCLLGRRLRVELTWRNQFSGAAGQGRARGMSDLTGSFSFDDPRNLEVMVKALDFGDRVLVLWGALSNLEYELKVTDTRTGRSKAYRNPAGTYCGGLDEKAF